MSKSAELHRMVMDDHVCPFGIKAKDLLERSGYEVEDHPLESREKTDAFMEKHGVETTPQVFIDGERIGGYDDLRVHLGKAPASKEGTTYQPVIAIFATTALMALAATWARSGTVLTVTTIELFIAFSMCALAIQKLRDLEAFSNTFVQYDMLARRVVPYAYVYPFGEAFAGIGMIGSVAVPVVATVALFIGTIGAISVIKAVYIDKRDLKCACVGGDSDVPLGFISLTENLMMAGMAVWMFVR